MNPFLFLQDLKGTLLLKAFFFQRLSSIINRNLNTGNLIFCLKVAYRVVLYKPGIIINADDR